MLQRSITCCALVALGALAPRVGLAQPTRAVVAPARREGTVVRLDEEQIVVDLGHATGVGTGSSYTVYRPITVTHPVTGRVLRDRFPIGTVVVAHAGQTMSVTHPSGTLTRAPRVGDVVVPARVVAYEQGSQPSQAEPDEPDVEAPAPVTALRPQRTPAARPRTPRGVLPLPPDAPVAAVPASASASPEEWAAMQVFTATLGIAPELRVQRYERFLREHPNSPYVQPIVAEVRALLALIAATQRPTGAPESRLRRNELNIAQDVPVSLRVGDPAMVAVQLAPDSTVHNGTLYVRRRGESTYERVPMRFEGDGYLRAEVPAADVTVAGFEYFVEVVPSDGRAVPVLGNAESPRPVEVLPPPAAPPATSGRTRVDLRGEYADVGTRTIGGGLRVQRFITVEGDFLQRLDSSWLYGYRVGFGVYDGEAIPLALLASSQPSVHTRVIYGYHELEFAPSDFVHLIARLQIGVYRSGLVPGFQARMRLGNERRTNIVLGGDVLGEVGQRAFFAFNFAPTPKLPMMAQGEVFNQSVAAGDPMFRFIGQAGYRVASWCTLSLRGSYQLRNIQNGGFGFGLSTTFDW